jgi:archaemetzincin
MITIIGCNSKHDADITLTEDLLRDLAYRLEEVLAQDVQVGTSIELSGKAYNAARDQYRGAMILEELERLHLPDADRVLGITDADCYAPGLNFILGQAAIEGKEAFVALARLRPNFYGRIFDPELFRRRAVKEMVHELGHTWGLSHCPNPDCVMHFSNTLRDTDRKGVTFCPRCHEQLEDTELHQPTPLSARRADRALES